MGEDICIKNVSKKSKNLTRKLKITLINKKEKSKAQTTQKKYGQEIQPGNSQKENIRSNKNKNVINLSTYQGNVLKIITPHPSGWQKLKVRKNSEVKMQEKGNSQ